MSTTSPSSAQQAQKPSSNPLLLLILSLGVGILLGYGSFVTIFHSQCSTLLQTATSNCSSSKSAGSNSLQQQLTLTKSQLHEALEELKNSKQQRASDSNQMTATTASDSDDLLESLHTAIQHRHRVACIEQYGPPPYTIEWTVAPANQAADQAWVLHLTVSTNAVNTVPHTVYTILKLQDQELYVGTTLKNEDSTIVGGTPSSCGTKRCQSVLTRRYAELGYMAQEVFLFREESATAQCGVTWPSRGPHVVIYPNQAASCDNGGFARVSRGMEQLQNVLQSSSVTILQTRVLTSAEQQEEAGHGGEL